jgi:18S rRNA (guanine1575-N7)-methyltransferase
MNSPTNSISSDSSKAKKSYLVLTCGPPSVTTSLPKGKGENGEGCSDDDDNESSGEDGDRTVS